MARKKGRFLIAQWRSNYRPNVEASSTCQILEIATSALGNSAQVFFPFFLFSLISSLLWLFSFFLFFSPFFSLFLSLYRISFFVSTIIHISLIFNQSNLKTCWLISPTDFNLATSQHMARLHPEDVGADVFEEVEAEHCALSWPRLARGNARKKN